MKLQLCTLPVFGVILAAGCAGPLDQRWDDPVYRSLQDRYSDIDSDLSSDPSLARSFDLDSLDGLSVEDAVRFAIENSPLLRDAGYRVDAASGRVLQAGLYPNPSLSVGAEALGAEDGGAGESAYVIEQEIVLGGKLHRARDVAESDRLIVQAAFIAQEFRLASDISIAYFGCVAANERFDKREELAELASELLNAVRTQVDAGAGTVPDRLRAEVVFEQAQIELDSARFNAHAARQALASLMGVEQVLELPFVTPIDQLPSVGSREQIVSAALEANTKISLARISIVRAKQAYQLAKANAVPSLVVSIGPRHSDIDDETTIDVELGIEIPLFDRNQGEISARLAERLSASAQLQSTQLALLSEISEVWALYQSSASAARRYQDQLLPKAELTLDLTRQAYQSGKADYLRVLDAQQVVVESHISYINTLEQLHKASALLNELSHTNTPWRSPRDEDQNQVEVNQ